MSKQREKAIAVIESCITEEQLPVAFKYICLFHKQTQDSDSYFELLALLKAKESQFFSKKVTDDIIAINKKVADLINLPERKNIRITSKKPTYEEVLLHQMMNPTIGITPEPQPFYQRRIKLSKNEHGS